MNLKRHLGFFCLFLVIILRGAAVCQSQQPMPNVKVVLLGEKNVKINPYYVRFKNLSSADGFFNMGTYKFLSHDTLGNLWFWQDQEGLIRYNGIASTKFGDAEGYFGREIRQAATDRAGNLWFATQNGLWQYDIRTGKFAVFENPHLPEKSLYAVNALPDGTFWVSTLEPNIATWVFDPLKKQFLKRLSIIFNCLDNTQDTSNAFCIYGPVYTDLEGIVWCSGHTVPTEAFCSIDLSQNKATFHTISLANITHFVPDEDGIHFWMGGWTGGLKKYNKNTHQWTQYNALNGKVGTFNTDMALSLAPKNADELWVNGNTIFNKKTTTYQAFLPDANNVFSFRSENLTITTTLDALKGYWATGIGVTYFSPFDQRFMVRPLTTLGIAGSTGCYDAEHNSLLIPIGPSDKNPAPSIVRYNVLTKAVEQKFFPELLKATREGRAILKIFRSKKEKNAFWVLTANGLYAFNSNDLTLVQHPLSIKLPNGQSFELVDLTDIAEDKEGELWLTRCDFTVNCDVLLMRYNPTTKALTTYTKNQPKSPNWFTFPRAQSVFCDSKGYVWMGSAPTSVGLNILNPKTNKVKSYRCKPDDPTTLSHDVITHFGEDAQGRVWLKTDGGFCFKTVESPTFERVSGFKGNYHNFVFDKKGHIWVGNGKGLFCLDTLTRRWRSFDERHGIINYANRIVINDDSSRIFLGKDIEFDPSVFDQKAPPPQISIESFNVFDKPLPLPNLPHFMDKITLEYAQNFFSIGFVGVGFHNPEETQYAYQLVSVEPDWVNCGTRRTAFYTNISAGEYEFRVKAMNGDGVWSAVKTLKISVLPPWWQTWWFRILAALLIGSSLWFFYQNRLQQVRLEADVKQKETELLQKEAEFSRSLAETEMSALRAQMNPHFIFNCLNSINNYMLDNNGLSASLYLTKFSRLIRLVLENSRTEKVSLANEMDALELYMQMETLRFKEKLRYKINVSPSVQTDFIEIPPLLLQPYVENAIWHGLMHRKEGGTVTVNVTQPDENILHIEIVDDGIGREAAMELKSRSATRRKSFGMQITSERLQAINDIFGMRTEVTIVDMVNIEGGAEGTKVIIEIPC